MSQLVRSALSSLRFVARAIGGFSTVLEVLAVLVFVLAVASPSPMVADIALLALSLIFLGRIGFEIAHERKAGTGEELRMGNKPTARILLIATAAILVPSTDAELWFRVPAGLLMALVVCEHAVRRPVLLTVPQIANVPGWQVPLPSTKIANWFFNVVNLGIFVAVLTAVFDWHPGALIAVTLLAIGFAAFVSWEMVQYLVAQRRYEKNLPKILADMGPKFAFHWQAPAGTAYQAAMWLPYLKRIGVPYFILTRTKANFEEVSKMTDAPVILRVGLEDLDPVVTDSLKVVFYANTAVRNSHMIRFTQLTHIQLNHGDSDKIASVSPTFRQYDKNFVAGQAAIDRFETHGVATLPGQFEIVGRPQLEAVERTDTPIADIENKTVLYSPTWSGFYDDSDYSSLRAGPAIVQALLDRGCTIVFRPHPYARRHKANTAACNRIIELLTQDAAISGRKHLFGSIAESEMSVFECFNASDAMVSDVSSVVSDYLFSGKPFAMVAVASHGTDFTDGFPLARAAYVIDVVKGKASGLEAALDEMLGADPRAEERAKLRTHYLSDTPPERIAERFIDVARRFL